MSNKVSRAQFESEYAAFIEKPIEYMHRCGLCVALCNCGRPTCRGWTVKPLRAIRDQEMEAVYANEWGMTIAEIRSYGRRILPEERNLRGGPSHERPITVGVVRFCKVIEQAVEKARHLQQVLSAYYQEAEKHPIHATTKLTVLTLAENVRQRMEEIKRYNEQMESGLAVQDGPQDHRRATLKYLRPVGAEALRCCTEQVQMALSCIGLDGWQEAAGVDMRMERKCYNAVRRSIRYEKRMTLIMDRYLRGNEKAQDDALEILRHAEYGMLRLEECRNCAHMAAEAMRKMSAVEYAYQRLQILLDACKESILDCALLCDKAYALLGIPSRLVLELTI